jgi:hypothetical protein
MAKTRFDWAWQHHKDKNKHHWDYWHERDLPMPSKYIKQMIVDWTAMGIKFGDTPQLFYMNNYDKIKLDYNSRLLLEFDLMENDSITNNYGTILKDLYRDSNEWFVKKENFGYLENKYGFEFNVVFKK